MVKLSPAMTTALPRSISSGTTALRSVFLFAFDLIELNGDAVAARSAGGAQGRARV
jgi:hypothetical protein